MENANREAEARKRAGLPKSLPPQLLDSRSPFPNPRSFAHVQTLGFLLSEVSALGIEFLIHLAPPP